MGTPEPTRAWGATRRGLAEAMAQLDGALPGSVVVRHMRCGKPGCKCKADPPALHGPYIQWTRTVHGKTVTRLLSETQLARYQPWFDNARRLKELIAKLEIASAHAIERSEGWAAHPTNTTTPTGSSRRTSK
ncbi:MAG: hypothetical protein HYX32_04820 [Actinobacteria bacterium]|nr:hypothetical protein [Actinomycetota bacterium]